MKNTLFQNNDIWKQLDSEVVAELGGRQEPWPPNNQFLLPFYQLMSSRSFDMMLLLHLKAIYINKPIFLLFIL
jgi:hypothetical protein